MSERRREAAAAKRAVPSSRLAETGSSAPPGAVSTKRRAARSAITRLVCGSALQKSRASAGKDSSLQMTRRAVASADRPSVVARSSATSGSIV